MSVFADRLGQVLQGQGVALDELGQHVGAAIGLLGHRLVEVAHPLAVAQGRVARQQAVAEQPLHLAGAGIAEGLGEADDGRGLHPAALGDHRQGLQRHLVGLVQHIAGDLLQPLAQRVVALEDRRAQFLGRGRRGFARVASSHRSLDMIASVLEYPFRARTQTHENRYAFHFPSGRNFCSILHEDGTRPAEPPVRE
jgi:hypothetical protein